MSQLGEVNNDVHVRTGRLSLGGRGCEGEGSSNAMDRYSKRLTSVLSLLRGERRKSLDRLCRESRKFGNSTSSVPTCVATRLRAGTVACAVLSAVIEGGA